MYGLLAEQNRYIAKNKATESAIYLRLSLAQCHLFPNVIHTGHHPVEKIVVGSHKSVEGHKLVKKFSKAFRLDLISEYSRMICTQMMVNSEITLI